MAGTTQEGGRGFAGMDAQKQREIASKGGKAAHQKGTAHEFTPEEARRAGSKGGEAVSRDREHMARIGREGGMASHSGSRKGTTQERRSEDEEEETQESSSRSSGTRGETQQPHVRAGEQSQKNS